MSLKGKIREGHLPVNKFSLVAAPWVPKATFVTITVGEEELDVVELPDRTRASGGNTKPIEVTATIPEHHRDEVALLEAWLKASQDPVQIGYKVPAVLTYEPLTKDTLPKIYTFLGMFPTKRKPADLDMANEGEMAVQEWTFSVDDLLPGII